MNLTLEQLCWEVEAQLERRGLERSQADRRVNPAPDARTIRYYATYGLLDRPLREGREVRYGERHLLQLLAIKALQARGASLAEIQTQVYGRSNAELETLLQSQEAAAPAPLQAVVWREVVLEPGLKLMIEQDWSPGMSPDALEHKVRAALAALGGSKS